MSAKPKSKGKPAKKPAASSKRRICVLGNSHVAALKGGWNEGKPVRSDIDVDFFGALSDGMASLALVDGKLVPIDAKAARFFKSISGREDAIEPGAYDAFVLCGMGLFPTPAFKNYDQFSTPATCNLDAPHLVSDACIHDTVWGQIDGSMMMHCARLVRSVTDKPIFLAWQAFWAETLVNIDWRRDQMTPIMESGDQAFVHAAMAHVSARLSDEGFIILDQPVHTIAEGVMTKAEYSRGSVLFREKLDKPHRENDVFHMNSTYGRACWEAWAI